MKAHGRYDTQDSRGVCCAEATLSRLKPFVAVGEHLPHDVTLLFATCSHTTGPRGFRTVRRAEGFHTTSRTAARGGHWPHVLRRSHPQPSEVPSAPPTSCGALSPQKIVRVFRPGNRTGKPTQLNSNQAGLGVWSLYSTVTLHGSQNSKQNRRGPQDSPGPGAASVPCSKRAVMSFPTEGQQARHTLHRLTMRRKHGKQFTATTIHCNSLRPPAWTPAHHADAH